MEKILEDRRKTLLNTMILGIWVLTFVAFITEVIESWDYLDEEFMIPVMLALLILLPLFLLFNKYAPSWIVSSCWLVFVFIIIYFADTPEGLIAGKSSLAWVLAILPAAFISRPWTSFLSTGIATGLVFWLAAKSEMTYGQIVPGVNVYLLVMLWMTAFLSWLASRNMISALEIAHAEQERLKAILENAADGIIVLDSEGNIERANPVALGFFNGKLEELARPENDTEVTVPDGRIVSLSWALVPDVGRVAIVRDITREVEVGQMKDAMLAVVSHELRTPLAGILGAVDLIGLSPTTVETSVEIIRRNGKRLLRLVNDLLDRAQLESGEFNLDESPFLPTELRTEIADLTDHHRSSASIEVELDFRADEDKSLYGDLGRIVQIVRNLVDNAVKFTLEGRVVTKITIEKTVVEVLVSDTGEGIPAQQLPDIWKPFRRASDFGVRKFQGVGLGLSIAHALVTKMNGEVSVSSTLGEGSVFKITIPLEYADDKQ